MGTIKQLQPGTNSFKLSVAAEKIMSDIKVGDSIAVNGVCLTVIEFSGRHFVADVMPETVAKTTLKKLGANDRVNLERALRPQDRMGGHIVQGHIDGIGEIVQKQALDIAIVYRIKTAGEVLKYIVPKGSIAIDGISLTIVEVFPDSFTVSLIPHTANITVLGNKKPGDLVNLESDILGRYIEKLINHQPEAKTALSMGYLAENGFL